MFEQSRLEESLKKQLELQQAVNKVQEETERAKEKSSKEKMEWESERRAMAAEISELQENLRHKSDMLRKMEGKHKV